MSWPAVRSLHELVTVSELIVVGTVTSAESGRVVAPPGLVDDIRVGLNGLPFTISSIEVEHSCTGAARVGGTVGVWQEGADGMPMDTSTTFTLLQFGRRYLLFLSFDENLETYKSVGGPQGMYQIVDEKVLSLDGEEHGATPWLIGESVDRAAHLITEALTPHRGE
jgi:hypothetical protein